MPSKATSLLSLFAVLAVLAPVESAPTIHDRAFAFSAIAEEYTASDFRKQDALDAQNLNGKFTNLRANDTCITESVACINSSLANCVVERWELRLCGAELSFAFPKFQKNGTAVGCITSRDAKSRFDTGRVTGEPNGTNSTTSTTMTDDCSTSASSSASQTSTVDTSATSTSSATDATTSSVSAFSTGVTVTVTITADPSSSSSTVSETPDVTTIFTTTGTTTITVAPSETA